MTDGWRLVYEGFGEEGEGLREALCTLGNGRFATRGAAAWARDDGIHYPGTYLAGGYNRLTSDVAGRDVVNEDLVNFPNWLPLTLSIEEGPELADPSIDHKNVRQELDVLQGELLSSFTACDEAGRETHVSERRIVSMADPTLAAIEWEIVPLNWSGRMTIRSGLDGSVTNHGVPRYRELRGDHLEVRGLGQAQGAVWLQAETNQSGVRLALAARTVVQNGDDSDEPTVRIGESSVESRIFVRAQAGGTIRVEKIVCLRTSRDAADGDLVEDALLGALRAPEFGSLHRAHRAAWAELWERYDVEIDVDSSIDTAPHSVQQIVRLHTFHLLQTASPHTVGLDVHVPARGLHGEAYRGHIFWDEMYLFPFYLQRDPDLARSLLLYRYRRLPEARAAARDDGHAGAMFPWQSGSNGREETQVIHLNPKSGHWDPDHSHLQRHVSSAIAYDVWSYFVSTGDRAFLLQYGAEMLIEIARFWASMTATRDDGGCEIVGVMGPDEYHEAYPGAEEGGLRNNAYTNVMAAWCIQRALDALALLDEDRRRRLCERLNLDVGERDAWDEIVTGMTIPVLPNGLIEQFEGYDALNELDWEAYRAKYGRIGRLDRILKAEGDSPDRYKLSKQADLCMLFYLFDGEEIRSILQRMGYEMTDERMLETIEYYRQRTSHGSTLSHLVFAGILDALDRDASWTHFIEALRSDVDDIQGGTTPEGIHAGVMAGTVRHVIERFAGLRHRAEGLLLQPRLPQGIERIRFSVVWRDQLAHIEAARDHVRVHVPDGSPLAIPILIGDRQEQATPGTPLIVRYSESS